MDLLRWMAYIRLVPPEERLAATDVPPGSVGDVFALIRFGKAVSRSAIARESGLAPSTASLRVDTLIRLGLVVEGGEESSRGGRRAKLLEVAVGAGVIAAIEVHTDRARLVIADLSGIERSSERLMDIVSDDPAEFVERIWRVIEKRVAESRLPLRGVAISVPAPVTYPSGRVVTPSFKPTWNESDLPALFSAWTEVAIMVENDANLIAFAESRGRVGSELLAVKLGSRIGCGVVVGGRLHRGVGGAAGEVSHTPVDGIATIDCACGIEHCLEAVASGAAVVARLAAAGYPVVDVRALAAPALVTNPVVSEALREAGTRIGRALSSIVNFMNPREVVLGGTLASSAPLVAAVRAELFTRCMPIVTADLEVRTVTPEARSVLRGAVLLALDEVLAPARVDQAARELERDSGAA